MTSITNPDDFDQSKVPELTALDTLLRCDICKEFYTSPVLSNCGHSFCSLCIRRYLVNDPKCALCGRELRESGLRRNGVLEELVNVFTKLRPELLDSIKIEANESNERVANSTKSPTVDAVEIIDLEESITDDEIQVIDVKKRKNVGLDMLLKKKPKVEIETGECPICLKRLPLSILQTTHIDSCLSESEVKKSNPIKKIKAPVAIKKVQPNNLTLQKLPKLDSTISTQQLKSKLNSLELPTTGSRFILEQRYIEYSTLWNANCDSGKPKDPRVLRRELNRWESLVLRDLENKKDQLNRKDNNGDHNTDDNASKDEWKELLKKAKETRIRKDIDKENRNQDPQFFE